MGACCETACADSADLCRDSGVSLVRTVSESVSETHDGMAAGRGPAGQYDAQQADVAGH